MLGTLRATPRLQRIEAQLMPFGTELDPVVPFAIFPPAPAAVHAPAARRKRNSSDKPLSPGLRIEPWTDRAFEPPRA